MTHSELIKVEWEKVIELVNKHNILKGNQFYITEISLSTSKDNNKKETLQKKF